MEFKQLIGGRLVDGDGVMEVINPATEEVITTCPKASIDQLNLAVSAAKSAFGSWKCSTLDERRAVLNAIADVLDANADELARLLTMEQGKPLGDAMSEISYAAGNFRAVASMDIPVKILRSDENKRIEEHRYPLGVIAAITPWNVPIVLMSFKVPAALLAGNTVILKPAATTPLSTLKFGELIAKLVPPGVVNVISDANDLGQALTSHPDVCKISFTGSTATGSKVMASAASLLKRVTLELGGNDASIVLDDVDVRKVAPQLFQAAFQNNGQVCIAMKRLYVHASIYDEVCNELAMLADGAVVGNGLNAETQLGPLQNKVQWEKVKELIEDAKQHGRVIAGGTCPDEPGYFIRPTIIRDINHGTRLVDEEQFGPVLPVIKYSDIEEVVQRANSTKYGLGGSVWSADPEKAYRVAVGLEAGTVWINTHGELSPDVPFTGAKQSGQGVELGEYGLAEYTQLKIVNVTL